LSCGLDADRVTLGSIIAEWTLNLVTGDIRICCVFLV
jgi:hypothetical protein